MTFNRIHDVRGRTRKRLPIILEMAKEIKLLQEREKKWRLKAAQRGDADANLEITMEEMRDSLAKAFYESKLHTRSNEGYKRTNFNRRSCTHCWRNTDDG